MPKKKSSLATEKTIQPDIDSTKVMMAVSSAVDFMKQQVRNSLVEASHQGKIEVNSDELRKICSYVDSAMTTSFMRSATSIESSIKN